MARGPEISLSTLSATPASWRALFAGTATADTAQRTEKFVQGAKKIVGEGEVSASLHLARKIKTKVLARQLASKKIKISDIDVPEVKSYARTVFDMVREPGRAKNHLGWALTNVGSGRQQRRKVLEGLRVTSGNDIQVVRMQAWDIETKRGKKLLKVIESYKKQNLRKTVAIALEINADKQTPKQYLEMAKQQKQQLAKKGIEAYLDIDLGHIARVGQDPLAFLQEVLTDEELGKMVKFVTFNQYVKGEKEAHARLDRKGRVDFQRAAEMIGQYDRTGQEPTTILFETHPTDFQWLLAPEGGKRVLEQISTAYHSSQETT